MTIRSLFKMKFRLIGNIIFPTFPIGQKSKILMFPIRRKPKKTPKKVKTFFGIN